MNDFLCLRAITHTKKWRHEKQRYASRLFGIAWNPEKNRPFLQEIYDRLVNQVETTSDLSDYERWALIISVLVGVRHRYGILLSLESIACKSITDHNKLETNAAAIIKEYSSILKNYKESKINDYEKLINSRSKETDDIVLSVVKEYGLYNIEADVVFLTHYFWWHAHNKSFPGGTMPQDYITTAAGYNFNDDVASNVLDTIQNRKNSVMSNGTCCILFKGQQRFLLWSPACNV